MSIERFANTCTPTCDLCGTELPEEYAFEDAVDSKKLHGWHSVCDTTGEWWDLCPDCFREHANRLRGIGSDEFDFITQEEHK